LSSGPVKFWETIKILKNSHYFNETYSPSTSKQLDIDQYISKLAPDGVISNFAKCRHDKISSFLILN